MTLLEVALAHYFPDPAERAEVARALDAVGSPEPERVRAAVLRSADGDRAAIDALVARARRDYRDVLAGAEFPRRDGRPRRRTGRGA